jgi:orotate phosphoribosyltransferase
MSDNLIESFKKSNCIKEGEFKLRNGETSKYYFDMKKLVSHPILLKKIGDKLWEIISTHLKEKQPNANNIKLCGVPLGGIPIAAYISTTYNIPMIMVRDKVKNYGTQKQIEGEYAKEDNFIIIEDVITTGGSVKETLEILKDKINVICIGAIINRTGIPQINDINVRHLLDNIY